MATDPQQRREDSDWLGLGEASRLVGVNESTLRRWADTGLVQTFRTPGGHRRFAAADLRRIIDAAGDLSQSAGFDDEALERIRARLRAGGDDQQGWLRRLSPELRTRLAGLGRETVQLVERDLAADADRAALEADAAALGGRYAAVLRAAGVRLTDAVSAFAYFRRGMDEAVRDYGRRHGLAAHAAAGVWERVAVLEDQLLLGLTEAYEQRGVETQ